VGARESIQVMLSNIVYDVREQVLHKRIAEEEMETVIAFHDEAEELWQDAIATDPPIDPHELVARIKALLQQCTGPLGQFERKLDHGLRNAEALAKGRERCTLLIHPRDAAERGLADGDRVRVSSRVGEALVPAAVSDEVMPGVVSLPHGFGHGVAGTRLRVAARQPGVNSNRLADEQLVDELSGNAVLCGIPVEVALG